MKRGRAAARARAKALAVALALAIGGAAVAPLGPGPAGLVRAQEGTGKIVHSADGVLLRGDPAYEAAVLTTMPEGTSVALRTDVADTVYDPDGVTQWWPIDAGGEDGWVAGFYLEIESYPTGADVPATGAALGGQETAATADPPAEEPLLVGWDLANAVAEVAEPEGVNVRQDPGSQSPAVKALSYQTVVQLRVDETDTVYTEGSRWWPVRVDGLIGWVSGKYLAPANVPVTSDDTAASDVPGKVSGAFEPGSYVMATTDDGTGLNIRADGAPDAERIGVVPEDDVVQVMDGPFYDPIGNPWYLITDNAVTGFVSGWYLSDADQPGAALDKTAIPPKVAAPGVATGALAYPLSSWTLTQGFGCSPYWMEPWNAALGCNFHNGIDLAAPMYSPIGAADGGTVAYAGWCDCGLGYYVKIDHGNGFATLYGHMAEPPPVWAGEPVAKGDLIGWVGSTGASTGPHVHFIVDYDGIDEDPLAYL